MKTKYFTNIALLVSMAAFNPVAFAQTEATEKNKIEEKAAVIIPGSLTRVIADSATFSTLTVALKASGLDETLGTKGEFTIFAPTDDAFAKLPPGTLDKLLLPENKEKLRMLLLYHVIAGNVPSTKMTTGQVKSVNGEKLKINVSSDKIEIDDAKVFSADVFATNGVMHSLGQVLVPKSLEGFAGLKN